MSGAAMGQTYSHLTLEERCRLRGLMEMGLGKSEIARRLGRHRSTIDRELRRNRCADGYRPDSAERRAWARKLRGSRIARSTRLRAQVEDRLAMGWSPEQIAGRMELDGSEHAVSAESIYRHAYSPAGRRAGLPRLLARAASRSGPAASQRTPRARHPQPDADPAAADKGVSAQPVGHWEGDLMRIRRQRDILLTLQERRSRLTLARRLQSKDADLAAQAIAAELGGLPATARRTITHDNGGEFARQAGTAGGTFGQESRPEPSELC